MTEKQHVKRKQWKSLAMLDYVYITAKIFPFSLMFATAFSQVPRVIQQRNFAKMMLYITTLQPTITKTEMVVFENQFF